MAKHELQRLGDDEAERLRKTHEERLAVDQHAAAAKADAEADRSLAPAFAQLLKRMPTLTPQQMQEREKARREKEHDATRREIVGLLSALKRDTGRRLDPFSCTLDSYTVYDKEQAKAVDGCRTYVAELDRRVDAGRGLFLIGPPGTGKDHLCVAVARECVIAKQVSARWLDCATFRAQLRDSFKGKGGEQRLIKPFIDAGVLILSDPCPPGSQLTDFQAESLFRIVSGRYHAQRPTFVTANVESETDAEAALGTQTVDRLSHGCLRLRCKWESFRKREG
jgi:DNA replication protein DnaC